MKFTDEKLASVSVAPLKSALLRSARVNPVSVRLAFERLAAVIVAEPKNDFVKSEPDKFTSVMSAALKSMSIKLLFDRSCPANSVGAESVAPSLVTDAVSVDGVDDSDESSPPQLAKTKSEINAVVANFLDVFFIVLSP